MGPRRRPNKRSTGSQTIDIGRGGQMTFYAVEVDGTPDGNELWSFSGGPYWYSFGNAALDDAATLYRVAGKGRLLALDTATGTLLWERPLPGAGGGLAGPTVDNNGAVLVTSDAGMIMAYKAEGNHLDDTAPWPVYKHDLRATANVLTPIRDTAQVARPYCTSSPNSSGEAAHIGFSGTASLGADNATLVAGGCALDQFGMFFYGDASDAAPMGNGTRCVGGSAYYRLPALKTSLTGEAFLNLDYSTPPALGGQITAGSTWYFQCWFRDKSGGGTQSDLTDGLEVTFSN